MSDPADPVMSDADMNDPRTQHARLRIEYDGGPFRGWARQPGQPTVEGKLLAACDRLRLGDVRLRCAGRTDAGVHAAGQVASIVYAGSVPPDRLALALNQHLPAEIGVLESVPCDPAFDPRRDATSRAYEYRVLNRAARAPLRAACVLHHPQPLAIDLLQEAAAAIVGQHDFTAFTRTDTEHVYFHRTVLDSSWSQRGDELVYHIRANALMRHMVRILVGTMLAVGRGDWPCERLVALLDGAAREAAHLTAPPHGLCLVDVSYG